VQIATHSNSHFVAPANPIVILDGDSKADILIIHPLNTTATSPGFLTPKYSDLRTVTLQGFGVPEADDREEVEDFLRSLPSAFVKDPFYGLGLTYDLRHLTNAIEDIKGPTDLRVIKGKTLGLPKLDGRSYVIAATQLDNARKAIARIHDKALNVASDHKRVLANNTLLTPIDPLKYPELKTPYRKNAVLEAIGDSISRRVPMSRPDQAAVMTAAQNATRSVSRSTPDALLDLTREIEVVTLENLIERIEAKLEKADNEQAWQTFFVDNPFILRIAFSLPVMMFGGQIRVGGRRLDGSGDKISDFVVKAVASGNLSLVELKTPRTALLETREYRGGLYAPSRELSSAINQILDQRYQLQKSLANLKDASGVYDVESYAIQGLVIAGRTETDRDKLKSFELYRNALKSVTVITFDELVSKLKHLLEILQAPELSQKDPSPALEETDDEECIDEDVDLES
jgi:hypothetical protein